MAKASKKKKKAPFKLPPQLPWAAALLIAAIIMLALILHHQGSSSFLSLAQGKASGGGLGRLGAWLSLRLIGNFGYGAFWPVPALLALAWIFFKSLKINWNILFKAVGWVLFLFSALAIGDLINPGESGRSFGWGGQFGHYLALSSTGLIGRLGAWLLLPALGFAGLFMAVNPLWRVFMAALRRIPTMVTFQWPFHWPLGKSKEVSAAPVVAASTPRRKTREIVEEHDLGLEDDPLEEHEPVNVETPVPQPPDPSIQQI